MVTKKSVYIFLFSIIALLGSNANASCQCDMMSSCSLRHATQQHSGTAKNHDLCLSLLQKKSEAWCNTFPIGECGLCRSDWSSYEETGDCVPETKPTSKPMCIAYEHGWLNGRRIELGSNEDADLRNHVLNDSISSTWTAANCKLAVFEDFDFKGFLMNLGPGVNKTLGINDRISSLRCECR